MATYKLIQDIEAEDHILGPLTLRQFIFALIAIFLFYLSFLMVAKHFAFMDALFLPPAIFFAFFSIPFGGDQPTEIWFLAKLRFWFKPRKRIWDQAGVKEMVTITVPKKIEPVLTDGLSPYEVQSRLNALANTLDSRGWVVKNSNLNSATTAFMIGGAQAQQNSDRLVDVSSAAMPEDEVPANADILENSSPIAQQFDQMINKSTEEHREELIEKMNSAVEDVKETKPGNNQWFMPHIDNGSKQVYAANVEPQEETPDEAALAAKIKAQHDTQQMYFGNLRTIAPLGSAPAASQPAKNDGQNNTQHQTDSNTVNARTSQDTAAPGQAAAAPMTAPPDPAILSLANNNDFTVETIARQAKRAKDDELGQDEVVISLH
jgi:PrgI family protein